MVSHRRHVLLTALLLLCLPLLVSAQWLETTVVVGDGPIALTYNLINNKVYCANNSSDNVTVIDGASNSVITTVTVGDYPYTLIYNPTNNKVYCANRDNVTVIDGASNSVITTITVGDFPRAFTWNCEQNRTYVANYEDSSVSVIRDSMVGVEENTEIATPLARNNLVVYPNPAKMFFTIYSLMPLRGIRVYDVLGELVKTEDMSKFENGKPISVQNLNSGVYFVVVNIEDTEYISKLLVAR